MITIDLQNAAVVKALLGAGTVTNGNGPSADMNNAEIGSTNFILAPGTLVGGGTIKIQESDDETTWSDITGGSFSVAGPGDSGTPVVKRLQRTKRYVRSSTSGVTAAMPASLIAVGQSKFVYAAADGNTGVDRSPSS